jgi:hypothetical protein
MMNNYSKSMYKVTITGYFISRLQIPINQQWLKARAAVDGKPAGPVFFWEKQG